MKNLNFEYESADTNDVSAKTLRTLRRLGLKVIRVPLRMEGLSSEGDFGYCHENVNKMVIKYGGEILVGQYLQEYNDPNTIQLTDHSVWITPERKVVCLTKSNCEYDDLDNPIVDRKYKKYLEQGYILFVPRRVTKGFRGYETLPSTIWIKGNRISSNTHPTNPNLIDPYHFQVCALKNAHRVLHREMNIGVMNLDKGTFLRDYKEVA